MVTGGIVEYLPDTDEYELPGSHAAFLTRSASPDNIAVFAQYIGILGQVEDKIVDCFRQGGGVGYEHYPRFHEVMAEDSGQTVLAGLDEHILPLIGHIIPQLEAGIRVLDVAAARRVSCFSWRPVTRTHTLPAMTCLRTHWPRRAGRLKKRG